MKDINTSFQREELEKLPAPELEKILFAELDSESTDRDTVLQILSILKDRDSTDQADCPVDAEEAWDKYLKDCNKTMRDVPVARPKPRRWLGLVAAAVTVVFVLLMTVPQAVGADSIFDIIGRWTKNLFGFSHSSSNAPTEEYVFQTDNPGLQQIYDTVAGLGVTQPVVPTWVPDGYELRELKVADHRRSTKIYVQMNKDDQYIVITIEIYGNGSSNKYPKDEISAEEYEASGIKHYILQNEGKWTAVWNHENAECSVTVNEGKDTLCSLIDSIYWRNN